MYNRSTESPYFDLSVFPTVASIPTGRLGSASDVVSHVPGVTTARTSVHPGGVAAASEGAARVKVAALSVDTASPSASARRLESAFPVGRRPNDVGAVDM